MSSRRLLISAILLLTAGLLSSISLNCFLYDQGRRYYLQLNEVRLDPLGLSQYSTTPDQRNRTNSDLTTVVFFGDSRVGDWPAPALEGFEFVNRGIGAQTSAQVVQRFDRHVKPLQPQVVVVQVGINDLKAIPLFPERKGPIIANCQENIRQIVAQSTDLGAAVILTTIFPTGQVPVERRLSWSDDVGRGIDQVNDFVRSLVQDKVLILDAYAILANGDGQIRSEYSRDLLHLSAAGYERLNDELIRLLIVQN